MSEELCDREGCDKAATIVLSQGDKQVRMCDEHWNQAMSILGVRKNPMRRTAAADREG